MSKPLSLAIAIAATCAACASPERSRNLNDPSIPASATAQQVCSNCHGIDGNSDSPNFPRLAGQQPAYIVEQLKAFRAQNRLDPAGFTYMYGLSRHLTDGQIESLAAYFAAQEPTQNPVHADAAVIAKGKELFENGRPQRNVPPCAACHGAAAHGNATFPRLAGQHAHYLAKQLDVFQSTNARPTAAPTMKPIAHELDQGEIDAVSLYLQGVN